jgi:hypothetical protein
MVLAVTWNAISGLKDVVAFGYERAIEPMYTYLSGTVPDQDAVSQDRQAFLAGYYSYQLYRLMKSHASATWPIEFEDVQNRLEGSLMSLGFKDASLVHEIDPSDMLIAIEKYQRVRSLTEAYLDKRSKSSLSSFHVGLDLALLIEESASTQPSSSTIATYVSDLKEKLRVIRETTSSRLPPLPAEQVSLGACCVDLQKSFVDSYMKLAKFYGITSN